MAPPTSIDGTDITGATIDGQTVDSITVDGQTVFRTIPDSVVHLFEFENNFNDAVGSLGVTSSNTTFTSSPALDGSASLRGDGTGQTVDFNSNVNVDATNQIAFSMSLRFGATSSNTGVFSVDDSGANGSFDLTIRSGELTFNYRNAGSNAGSSAPISSGTTLFVQCQYDNSNAETKLAIDGNVVDSNTGSQIDGVTKNVNGLMKAHFVVNNTDTIMDNFAVHDQLII